MGWTRYKAPRGEQTKGVSRRQGVSERVAMVEAKEAVVIYKLSFLDFLLVLLIGVVLMYVIPKAMWKTWKLYKSKRVKYS